MAPSRKPPPERPIYESDLAPLFDLVVYDALECEASEAELSFLDWAFRTRARRRVRDVLDAGCGTGRFLVPLARAGYRATGVDCGAGCIRESRRRLKKHGLDAALVQSDIRSLDADRGFDAVIGMDSILCYMHETAEVLDLLRRFRRALRPGGVLVLANANVLARLQDGLGTGPQVSRAEGLVVRHREANWYDPFRSLYHIRAEGTVTRDGKRSPFLHRETVRVFTPEETRVYLEATGFVGTTVHPSFDPEDVEDVEGDYLTFVATRPGGRKPGSA